MNTKLQELTEKIYLEGVEKGNEEAATIIANAELQAAQILAKAHEQAAGIIKDAEDKSAELSKNTQSELQLFARQSVNALKSEITDLICGNITASSVKAATADAAFMQQIILKMVAEMAKSQTVTIETKDAEALTAYFRSNAKDLLNKGVKISEVNKVKTEFSILADKDGYKLTFGEDEFMAYFKAFLRPKLVDMLF